VSTDISFSVIWRNDIWPTGSVKYLNQNKNGQSGHKKMCPKCHSNPHLTFSQQAIAIMVTNVTALKWKGMITRLSSAKQSFNTEKGNNTWLTYYGCNFCQAKMITRRKWYNFPFFSSHQPFHLILTKFRSGNTSYKQWSLLEKGLHTELLDNPEKFPVVLIEVKFEDKNLSM